MEKKNRESNSIKPIVRIGYTGAMDGKELWVNTETDEIVKFVVDDNELRWEYYCKNVKVTIEIL